MEAVFDRQLRNACPLAKHSRVIVDLINAGDDYELKPVTPIQNDKAVYNLPKTQEPLDIRMSWNQNAFQYRKVLFITIISFFFCQAKILLST